MRLELNPSNGLKCENSTFCKKVEHYCVIRRIVTYSTHICLASFFDEHSQTVLTKIRCSRTRGLISIFAVSLQNAAIKIWTKRKIPPNTPKIGHVLILLIRVGKPIRFKMVNQVINNLEKILHSRLGFRRAFNLFMRANGMSNISQAPITDYAYL